jgi:ketosteroid isomerase-like protein
MNLKEIALDWIDAWNKKDIDRIMSHYSEDIIFFAPTVIKRWGIIDGRINGKEQLRKHFLKGFELAPNLHFEFIDLLTGVDGITIIYKRETGAMVADVIQLDNNGKGKIVKAYYGEI